MENVIKDREIRVGVLGAFRGEQFARTAEHTGMKLVAICDNFEYRLKQAVERYNVKGYPDFDDFIKHDMDAIAIASPFHQHAGFAIKAMDHGLHVMSETSCNITLAEGVELYRKAEETGLCYMLAENYCYTKFNQEMKRLYDAGEIGEIRYAEGEYNHPLNIRVGIRISPGTKHWRNNIPGCYYNTHALAPMMYITNTMPVEVSGIAIPSVVDGNKYQHVIIIRMDNGAIFRIIGGSIAGHSCWYRFHGTSGAMEASRGPGYFGPETVRVWHEPWDLKEGQELDKVYMPKWPSHQKEADQTGHGGGDFFVEYHFANAIRTGEQPYLNAYRGVTMSNIGILAWRSIHQHSAFIRVPDLKNSGDQEEMLKDRLCPLADVENSVLMPPEMLSIRKFTPELTTIAREVWKEVGYTDAEIEELLKP